MWLFRRKKVGTADGPTGKTEKILTALGRRNKEEIVRIQFLAEAICYDVDRSTIIPQTIKIGIYELVKTTIAAKNLGPNEGFWYLFKGTRIGLTERSLNRLITEGRAQIVK